MTGYTNKFILDKQKKIIVTGNKLLERRKLNDRQNTGHEK